MQGRISAELDRLEREQEIRVVYAAESGSRAWGFPSRDSDWDVRFIYVHTVDWYLTIEPGRDVVERPIDDGLDLSGWDIRKALHLLRKGNAVLPEWLDSPIVYREVTSFAHALRGEIARCYRPRAWTYHYLSMAKKNYREYLRRDSVRVKKYFYVLRPLLACEWMRRTGAPPPMEFGKLLAGANLDPAVLEAIQDLLERKKRGEELDEGARIPVLNEFVEHELESYRASAGGMEAPAPSPRRELDELFRETLAQAWPG